MQSTPTLLVQAEIHASRVVACGSLWTNIIPHAWEGCNDDGDRFVRVYTYSPSYPPGASGVVTLDFEIVPAMVSDV